MKSVILVFLAALQLLTLQVAHSESSLNPCDSLNNSHQVFMCSEHSKKQADHKLNESYNRLLRRVDTQYSPDPEIRISFISTIKKSQRAWIVLRDANCAVESFEIEAHSEAHTTTINNCIARMSQERADYLDRISPQI
jgi:uncharacterized protein YecT (DUF1311 family)